MPKKATAKLTLFDKHVLERVGQGQGNLEQMRASMNVDAEEFRKRIATLTKQKLLVVDSTDSQLVRLGIKGYSELAEAREKEQAKAAKKAVVKDALTPKEEHEKAQEAADAPGQTHLDIAELANKYGPREGQHVSQEGFTTLSKHAKELPPVQKESKPVFPEGSKDAPIATRGSKGATNTPAPQSGEGERCALCKEAFSLAVKHGNPIYARCVCGAPYHEDCYQAQTAQNAGCVRCGKKLRVILDRESEEAVRGLKSAFD